MSLVQNASDSLTQAFFKKDEAYFREMIGKGDKNKIELYLKKFPDAAQWKFGPHEYTTIHEAVMSRHLDLVPLFQSHGIDINQPTKGGEPPLRWAHNKDEISKMVSMGATMDDPRWKGLTPLMYAAMFAWSDQVEGLLEHGADPHKVFDGDWDMYKGKTALQIASRFTDDMGPDDHESTCQGRTVELLLAKGGHSAEELKKCRDLAGNWLESRPAAKLLQAALEESLAAKAEAEKQAIDSCVHGLPESTTVRRPLVLRKP
jgi:ankyrin repeat protein